MSVRAFHARVKGRVQGVSFRYYTRKAALALGLSGWVRNLPNGEVELTAEGEESTLLELAAWIEHGPSLARVEQVVLDWRRPTSEHASFTILY